MKFKSPHFLAGFFVIFLGCSALSAETENHGFSLWPQGSTLDLGLRLSSSKITVKDAGSEQTLAELSNVTIPAPSFTFGSGFNSWGKSDFGYKIKFGFSWFKIAKQKVGNELVDLGTSAEGFSIYGAPTVGYLFGDRQFKNGKGKSLLIGFGLGAGYVLANGEVILTEKATQDRVSFDINKPTFAVQLVIEARRNNWNFDIQVGGPTVEDNDFKYEVFDVSATIARTFRPEDFENSQKSIITNDEGRRLSLSLLTGSRELPVISNENFSAEKKSSAGGGLQLIYQPSHWPFGIVADAIYYSASSVSAVSDILTPGTPSNVTLESAVLESQFGLLAQKFFAEKWSWSLGGGVTTFYTDVSGTLNGSPIGDTSWDVGYWFGGGGSWHFKEKWSLSLQARVISVQTDLLDVFEEQTKGSFRLGLDKHF